MTKKIEQLIHSIEVEIDKTKLQLSVQIETNTFLIEELESLRSKNESLNSEIAKLEDQLKSIEVEKDVLNLKLIQLNEQNSNPKIDELVNEIDFCISQIKDKL